MSRATQIADCRARLGTVAMLTGLRLDGDLLRSGEVVIAERLGHTIVVHDVGQGASRIPSRSFFATEPTADIAAAVTAAIAARVALEVDHGA